MKMMDMLVSVYDEMPRSMKAVFVVIWVYVGIRYLVSDMIWIVGKLASVMKEAIM